MMNAIANVKDGAVHAAVEIAAPPARVFRALTDPELLERWWGSGEAYRTFDWKVDLNVGGKWSCMTKDPAGRTSTVHGEYLEIDPPNRLVCTWRASWQNDFPTTITYELEPIPDGTRLTLTHTGFEDHPSAASYASGWPLVLGWLSRHMAEHAEATAE